MVADPANYTWSSYQHNALGKRVEMCTPHEEYLRLEIRAKSGRKFTVSYSDIMWMVNFWRIFEPLPIKDWH